MGLTFVDPNSWIEDGDFARNGVHLNGRGKRRLGQLYARVSGTDVGGSAGSKMRQILENGNHRTRDTRERRRSAIEEQKTLHDEDGPVNSILMTREVEVGSRVKSVAEASAYRIECKSLVVLQVNCRSVYNKAVELWNLVDTYNPDVVIGTESWLKQDISNAEDFRADFTTFRRDRSARGGGFFICVKNIIASTELWVDEDFEMIAVEVKEMDPKYTWEIIGIYRAPNEDMLAIERLAARTLPTRNLTKQNIIGGDLNLPQADWKGDAEKRTDFRLV